MRELISETRRRAAQAIALILMFVPLAGCGRGASPAADTQGRAVAAQFLDQLRQGQLETAWQATTSEFKSLMGLESLRDTIKKHPALKTPAEAVESRDVARAGQTMAEHVFRATAKVRGKSVPATITVLVARNGGQWGVEQLRVE